MSRVWSRWLPWAALALAACSGGTPSGTPRPARGSVATSGSGVLPTGVALEPAARSFPVAPMPLSMVPAPGGHGRYVLLASGFYAEGLDVVDPAARSVVQHVPLHNTFYGLAFSPDSQTLYASGGNADVVYRFAWSDSGATLTDSLVLAQHDSTNPDGTRYPAGLAVSPDGKRLYVAENLADSIAVVNPASGRVVQRLPAGSYPYAVAVGPDSTVYVSAWGGFEVRAYHAELGGLRLAATIRVPRHPSALLVSPYGHRLFVVSASTDQIAVVDTRSNQVVAVLDDAAPEGPAEGSTPNALALSRNGARLFVAEADNNAVGVFDLSLETGGVPQAHGNDRLVGRIPVDWYPTALAVNGSDLIVATGKGLGTAPNAGDHPDPGAKPSKGYTLRQLSGSVLSLPLAAAPADTLAALGKTVAQANGWTEAPSGRYPPIQHVIYVIKENRTYDQVLGDLPQGDGDTALVFFPRPVSPNQHALAERFGIFDRFFVNAEVSADGHNWSTAAYASDYLEKTVQLNYSGRGRSYDYEGTNRDVEVADRDDAASPGTGYLWDLAAQKGISYRNYGEFVARDRPPGVPTGVTSAGENDSTPGTYHGVKAALRGHTDPLFPGFNLDIPDQVRADRWIAELKDDESRGVMPALQIMRLPNDHTEGAWPGKPTPRAYMADNDLALGRIIEALSRSSFWKSTVVFVLEDDAQDGGDHVDSHRSPMLVISPWVRAGVVHRFINTTDVLATIEGLLGLDHMSQFDFFGRPLHDIWAATPDTTPYTAITPQQSLTEVNPPRGPGARQSMKLDFREEDMANEAAFNHILWVAIKGTNVPEPKPTRAPALMWMRERAGH